MLFYIKKIISAIIALFVIFTLVFFMMRAIPGGPFTREKPLPAATRERLEDAYGLNDPLGVQYFRYMGNLMKFDLGPSFIQPSYTVNELIKIGLPQTAKVGIISVIFICISGILLGIVSALKANTTSDYLVTILATLGVTIPSFVIGALYILMAEKVPWIPVGGLDLPISFVGPVLALSGYSLAFVARLTRSSVIEVLNQDYVRTARANGLKESKVIFKYVLKNSLIPVITYIGPMIAALLTGSFVIEKIFDINGIGQYFTNAVLNRDYTLTIGITIFYSAFYILMVLIVDIVYSLIDPRIRLNK